VADILRDLILTGGLQPGEPVTHDQIAELVGVSTMPVREALLRLAHEGFIEAQENRSFRVTVLTRADIEDAFWVHAELSGELAARACEHASDRLVDALRALNAEDREAHADHVTCWRFHGQVNAAAESPKLELLLRQATRFVPEHYYLRSEDWREQTLASHLALTESIAGGDAARSRTLMVDHVRAAADFLIDFFTEQGHWREPTALASND